MFLTLLSSKTLVTGQGSINVVVSIFGNVLTKESGGRSFNEVPEATYLNSIIKTDSYNSV